MTAQEAVQIVEGLVGKTVEVSIRMPGADGVSLASTGGQVTAVRKLRHRDAWLVYMDAPFDPHFLVDAEAWQDGDYTANRYEEDVERTNITWTLILRHRGVETEVLIYA